MSSEAIRAEEKRISRLHFGRVDIYFDIRLEANGARNDVSHPIRFCLRARDEPRSDFFLNPGVVSRELPDCVFMGPCEVTAAVAHVSDPRSVRVEEEGRSGRAHSLKCWVFRSELVNLSIGHGNGFAEGRGNSNLKLSGDPLGAACLQREAFFEVIPEGFNDAFSRNLTGRFTALVPAHSIGYEVEVNVRGAREAILVVLALPADVGFRSVVNLHRGVWQNHGPKSLERQVRLSGEMRMRHFFGPSQSKIWKFWIFLLAKG